MISNVEDPIKNIINSENMSKNIMDKLSFPAVLANTDNTLENHILIQKCQPYRDVHISFLDEPI